MGVAVQSVAATLLLAVALPFALIVEVVGILLVVLSLIPPLRRFVGGVQRWLGGSLGDSYALLTSPLATASMLTSIQRDLEWTCARAKAVVVISHSQGAALAYQLLKRVQPTEVRRFLTVGAAVGKLEALGFVSRSMPRVLWASFFAAAFSLGATFFFIQELPSFKGQEPWILAAILAGVSVAVWLWILRFLAVSLGFTLRGLNDNRQGELALVQYPGNFEWHDLYGSVDPVSNGPTFSKDSSGYSATPIRNRANILKDHTDYLKNHETFWSNVLRSFPLDGAHRERLAPDDGLLHHVTKRRAARTTNLATGRLITLAIFALVLWWSLPFWSQRGNPDEWCWSGLANFLEVLPSWLGDSISTILFKPGGASCIRFPLLLLALPMAHGLTFLVWRLWERASTKAFMRRQLLGGSRHLYRTGYFGAISILMFAVALLAHRSYEPSRAVPSAFILVAALAALVSALVLSWRPYRFIRSLMFETSPEDRPRTQLSIVVAIVAGIGAIALFVALTAVSPRVAGVLGGTAFTILAVYLVGRPKDRRSAFEPRRHYLIVRMTLLIVCSILAVSLPVLLTSVWWLVLIPALVALFWVMGGRGRTAAASG